MKRLIIVLSIILLNVYSLFAETWTTLKEKTLQLQTISINESDTELCTLAAATTYRDAVAIFYCHAGLRDKEVLMMVYNFLEDELINNYIDVFDISSSIINDLLNEEILVAIKFDTDPLDTSGFLPCSRSHLYCGSYLDKVANDALIKQGIEPPETSGKPIPYKQINQILNKYKTNVPEVKPNTIEEKTNQQYSTIETEAETTTITDLEKETTEETEEIKVNEDEINKSEYDHINFSLYGGASLQLKFLIDVNLKLYINKFMFITIQGGGTPINKESSKISSFELLPQGTIGFGGSIKPIDIYKMNIFGYASVGLAYSKLKGGFVSNGEYKDTALFPMLRVCAGIDFPVSKSLSISVQDSFDYLINLGFTDAVSAGITIKF